MRWPPIAKDGSASGCKPSPSEPSSETTGSSPLVAAGQCSHPVDPVAVPRAAGGPVVAGRFAGSPLPARRPLSAPCAGLQSGAGAALHPAQSRAGHSGGPRAGSAALHWPHPADQAVWSLAGAASHHRHLRHSSGTRQTGVAAATVALTGAGSRQLSLRPVRYPAGPRLLQHAAGGTPYAAEHREHSRIELAPRQPARHALIPHLPAAGVAANSRHIAGAGQPHLHALLHQLHHSAGAGGRAEIHHAGGGRLSGAAL